MIISIDTNILLDILLIDPPYFELSKKLLKKYSDEVLVISPIVYSELLVQFLRRFDLTTAKLQVSNFLREGSIRVQPFELVDYELAAYAWSIWLKKRSQKVQCPSCGQLNIFACTNCKQQVMWKNHLITDFLIGAHAKRVADVFLTRDRGFYKQFGLKIEER